MTENAPPRRIGRRRIILAALLSFWTAARLAPIVGAPLTLDSRERVIAAEVDRVRQGNAPMLFHWPGTPWIALLAASTALAGTRSETATARVGRLWVILLSAVALGLFYRLASQRLPRNAALMAVAALAVAPGFASGESTLALVDVPALVLGLAGMSFALTAGKSPTSSARNSLLAGICLGVGGAVKLPTLALFLPVAGALTARTNGFRRTAARLGGAVGGGALGFLVGCPFVLVDLATGSDNALADMRYEFAHYRSGHFGIAATARDTLLTIAGRHLEAASWAFGSWTAIAVICAAAVWAWNRWSRRRESLVDSHVDSLWETLWIASTVGVLVAQRFTFPRHWLVALPPALLAAIAGIETLRGRARLLARAAFGGTLAAGLAMTLGLESVIRSPSTLDEYERWYQAERARQHRLVVSPGPAPPALTWLYPESVALNEALASVGQVDGFVVAELEANLQRSVASRPDAYRPSDFFPLAQSDFETGAFFAELASSRDYATVARFERPFPAWARWAAFPFRNPPLPLNALAHPTLLVYERR